MEECYFCGISGSRAFLFDAVSDEGIVKICRKCYEDERLPLVKKEEFFTAPEHNPTVRERLVGIAKFKERGPTMKVPSKEDENLRKIVEESFKEKFGNTEEVNAEEKGFLRNFHWSITRARRAKKMTQKQLAEAIVEPEIAIKMIEAGKMFKGVENVVKKLENYFRIILTKEQKNFLELSQGQLVMKRPGINEEILTPEFTKEDIDFVELSKRKDLKIADLQAMKKQRQSIFKRRKTEPKRVDDSDVDELIERELNADIDDW